MSYIDLSLFVLTQKYINEHLFDILFLKIVFSISKERGLTKVLVIYLNSNYLVGNMSLFLT